MRNLFHSQASTLLGTYDFNRDSIALSFTLTDEIEARATAIHESTHGLLTRTSDLGLAHLPLVSVLPKINFLGDAQKTEILSAFLMSQYVTQESLATLAEIVDIGVQTDRAKALEFAGKLPVPPEPYAAGFGYLSFVFDMEEEFQDLFRQKVGLIAMNTGIRREIVNRDLLRNPKEFVSLLEQPDHNADDRFIRITEYIFENPQDLRLPVEDLARRAAVPHSLLTSKEVADFGNYINEAGGFPERFTEESIANRPSDIDIFREHLGNITVSDLDKNEKLLAAKNVMSDQELLDAANKADLVFVIQDPSNRNFMEIFLEGPSIGIQVAVMNLLDGTKALNKELADIPLVMPTIYLDPSTLENTVDKLRPPDVVLCLTSAQLRGLIEGFSKNTLAEAKMLHAASSEKHLFRTVFILPKEGAPLICYTGIGNKEVNETLEKLSKHRVISREEIEKRSSDFNAYFYYQGQDRSVDWSNQLIEGHVLNRK